MELHQVQRLRVDVGIDHVEDHVLDEPLHLRAIPALGELEHPFLQALHLPLVGADEQVDELRVRAAEELAARDHPGPVERTRQRERARPRDDGLVQVEECGLHR